MVRYALILAYVWLGFALSPAAVWAHTPESNTGTFRAHAPLESGLRWRIFSARPDPDGSHPLLIESSLARPAFTLPPGEYVVHVSFGLASATKGVNISTGELRDEILAMSGGALRIGATIGDSPIDAANVSLAIYVPERNNAQAKLVYSKARLGDVIGVPEGAYHIVSTYLDTVGVGTLGLGKATGGGATAPTPTNSIVSGDVRVAAGKLVDINLKHRFAKLTIKLVKTHEGEALANTTFTVLTPGGDIIRELIGAFPSLVLAEGEYVVIARHDAKTYQSTFNVQSGLDQDVEVIAKEDNTQGQ
jgi:hypothetical protein